MNDVQRLMMELQQIAGKGRYCFETTGKTRICGDVADVNESHVELHNPIGLDSLLTATSIFLPLDSFTHVRRLHQ